MNSFYSKTELKQIGFKSVGEDVLISRKASIYGPEKMTIGEHVRIDDFCILSGEISIGNYIHIAAYSALFAGSVGMEVEDCSGISSQVVLYSSSDDYSGDYFFSPVFPDKYRKLSEGKVILRKFSLIGSGCTVLPGSEIGEGCSVGAMSLVHKSLKPWTIYAGIPCKEIKPRSKLLLELYSQLIQEENTAVIK